MEKRILTYPSSSRPSPTLEFLEFQESIGEYYGEMHTVSASEAFTFPLGLCSLLGTSHLFPQSAEHYCKANVMPTTRRARGRTQGSTGLLV